MSGGVLIVLEGIDGAGTTTQSTNLVSALATSGVDVHLTREPSDGPIGRLLREILAGEHAPTDASTLSLLFAADRADHIQREVAPAMARGQVVVSDRWYHSSLAYQGTGTDRAWIRQLNQHALVPALTILLDVNADIAAQRRVADDRDDELFDALKLQRRIAAGYKTVISELSAHERIEIIDGERSPATVAKDIEELVRETLKRETYLPPRGEPG